MRNTLRSTTRPWAGIASAPAHRRRHRRSRSTTRSGPAGRAACRIAGPANGASARTCRSSQAGHTCLKIFRWVMTHAGAGRARRLVPSAGFGVSAAPAPTALRAPTRSGRRPSGDSAAAPSSTASGRPPADSRRCNTAPGAPGEKLAAAFQQTLPRPRPRAADEALASDGDLVDRWTGPREAAFLLSGYKSRRRAYHLSSEASCPSATPPASAPDLTHFREVDYHVRSIAAHPRRRCGPMARRRNGPISNRR